MRIHACLMLVPVAVSLAGCPKPATPDAMVAKRSDPAALELIDAVGDRASVVIVARPDRWKTAAGTLKPLVHGLQQDLNRVLDAPTMFAAADAMLPHIPLKLAELEGLDPSRPIVVGLYEPQLNDLVLAARVVVPGPAELLARGIPGVRHRVLLPAKDTGKLQRGLALLFGRLGFKPAVEDEAGGPSVWALPSGYGFVALVVPGAKPTSGAYLRVEILTREFIPYKNDAERNAAWLAMIDDHQPGRRRPLTPAFAFTASRRDLLVVHLRPWNLRDLAGQLGAGMLGEALAYADPAYKQQLLAQGLSEVANAYLLMSPAGAELDDLAMALDLDGGLRITGCWSLTERGARIVEAGVRQGRAPLSPAGGSHLMTFWTRLNTNALLKAASTPPALAGVKKLSDISRSIMECGPLCLWHLVSRTPFGLTRTLLDLTEVDLTGLPPAAFSLAVLDVDITRPPARIAAAATYDGEAGTRRMREALAALDRESGGRAQSQLFVEPRGKDQVVKVGLGVDPREVFKNQTVKAPAGTLAETTADFGRIANIVAPASPEAASVLDRLGPLQGRSRLAGRALVGELVVGLKGKKPLAYSAKADYAGFAWETPGAAAESTRGAGCMRDVTRSMIQAFGALASADPTQRSLLMARVIEEVQPQLACALAEPDTKEQAYKTQRLLALYVVDLLMDDFHTEGALAVLDLACKQGHKEACDKAKVARETPAIDLVRIESPCYFPAGGGGPLLRVPNRELAPQLPEYDKELAAGQPPPVLVVDARTRYDRLAQVIAQVAQGRPWAELMVLPSRGGRGVIRIRFPGNKQPVKPMEPGLAEKFGKRRADRTIAEREGILALLKGEPGAGEAHAEAVIRLAGKHARLLGGGTSGCYMTAERETEAGCEPIARLALDLENIAKQGLAHPRIYLDAEPDVPFERMARVAAVAACDRSGDRYGQGQAADLFLGPVPDDVLERMKKTPAAGTGVLGLDGATGIGGLGTGGGGYGLGKLKGAPRIHAGKPVVMGSLSRDIIRRVIRKNQNQVRYCYEKELVKNPKLAGKILCKFVISPKGTVQSAKISSTTMKSKPVEQCLQRVLKRMKFPKPKGGGIVVVQYPFIFKSK